MAMTLRTDSVLDEALEDLSERLHLSKHEVVRQAILEKRDRQEHHDGVRDAAAFARQRWDGVIDRLSRT